MESNKKEGMHVFILSIFSLKLLRIVNSKGKTFIEKIGMSIPNLINDPNFGLLYLWLIYAYKKISFMNKVS